MALSKNPKITIWVAVIGAAGAIIAQIVSKPFDSGPNEYTGIVTDVNSRALQNARVTLLTEGPPSIDYTDVNGVFRIKLASMRRSVAAQIKVELDGYKTYTQDLADSSKTRIEDIRLTKVEDIKLSPTSGPPGDRNRSSRRRLDKSTQDHFGPLLRSFSGKVVQITTCPDEEPVSFANSLNDFLTSAGLLARMARTPNACDANPVRIVARDNNLLSVLADLLSEACGQSPLLQPEKVPRGSEDAAVIIGRLPQ